MTKSTRRSRSTIQSMERGFAVLNALSKKRDGATALELAHSTGIDRSTVHRLVRTLAGIGAIEIRGSSYAIGPTCLTLGIARLDRMNLRRVALPYAVDMQQKVIGQKPIVVSISARSNDEAVIVDRIWTASIPLDVIIDIGMRFPLDESVSGRSMLSTMTNKKVIGLLGMKRYRAISARLDEVRLRGGLEFGPSAFRVGVAAMASPLVDHSGEAVGCLVVGGIGLEPELGPNSKLAQFLQRSAERISLLLQSAP